VKGPVPLESWQVGPWNRWAYVNVGEVVDTVPVPRGDGPVSQLERWTSDLDDLADPLLETAYVDGLAVVHRGRLVAERYGGEMAETSLHLSQSVGKSVLGLLVGILAARGALDTEEQVTGRVPEVADSGYAGATVQHLLDMTAGIDFVEDYAVDFWRYDVACGWHPPVAGAEARTILEFLPTIGAAGWRHGERFHYATPNTDLLGLVAERAGDAPLAQLISDELWGPLGTERDAELTVDLAGTAAIGGGFCATLRDYARLGALVADGGRGVVPASWIEGLGRGDANAFARSTTPESSASAEGYRNQWWRRDGRTTARGIHGQLVAVDARTATVVTILSSWPDATDLALDAAHRGAVAQMGERLAAGANARLDESSRRTT
jgi:CubicO group peptidase (beta-lactamase class C family)